MGRISSTLDRIKLGNRITELRGGTSQEQLAEILNNGKQNENYRKTISRWENGRTEISLSNLIKLAAYFNVSLDYITGQIDFTHVGNEEIHDLTGLSDKAISNLTKQKETLDKWKSGKAASIIRTLNLILETEEGLEALQMIDSYVFADFELTRFKKKNIYTKRRLKEVKKKATRISGKAILKDVSGTGLIQAKDITTGNVQIFEATHLSNAFLGSVTDCVVKLKVANEKRLI